MSMGNANWGITPAYAGKSECICRKTRLHTGSPPPMRGKGYIRDVVRARIRITPAYAGKRPWNFAAAIIL